jgi:hypothetical protein
MFPLLFYSLDHISHVNLRYIEILIVIVLILTPDYFTLSIPPDNITRQRDIALVLNGLKLTSFLNVYNRQFPL